MRNRNGHIKKLIEMANDPTIDLWCEDECHFHQHGTRLAMWVPPENVDPVVLHAPTRKSAAVFGAARISDGRLETMRTERFNRETFSAFLARLLPLREAGKTMVVVLDNAKWHHAKSLKPWLDEHCKELRLDFLPAYSPELNPIERTWKLTRRLCTHNRYFETLEEMVEVVFQKFEEWQKPNETLRRLCAII